MNKTASQIGDIVLEKCALSAATIEKALVGRLKSMPEVAGARYGSRGSRGAIRKLLNENPRTAHRVMDEHIGAFGRRDPRTFVHFMDDLALSAGARRPHKVAPDW